MLNSSTTNVKQMSVNFGPQHPAAHGVLRLALQLNNERIVKCDPHIGLLHRATEYLITTKPNLLSLPYFDRLDYVSMLAQEHAYTLTIEKINKYIYNTLDIQKHRVIMDEITRILNHLLALACHALDVGSMSIIFWAFEERENFMEIYENVTGARMHVAYTRPMFFNKLIRGEVLTKLLHILQSLPTTLTEVNSILNNNKVWKIRLKNIGLLTSKDFYTNAVSGVLLRSIGSYWDLRQSESTKYSYYNFLTFLSYSGRNGDSLDRYNLRLYEILESADIINTLSIDGYATTSIKSDKYMENIISDFKIWSGTYFNNAGSNSVYIESPKGLFGTSITMDTSTTPLNCKIKSPSYNHLFLLKQVASGLQLADLITLIGTIDIVFGEVDR